ncbi:putative carboxylesterase 15 [Bienertia sinuspersici]
MNLILILGEYNKDAHKLLKKDAMLNGKIVCYDEKHQIYLRVYKPNYKKNYNFYRNNKMPILYYLHGGGFCLGSRTWPNCHNCCLCLCSQLQAFVVAPDYRLAPEHRLPAAIEDGLNAVKWLQLQAKKKDKSNHSPACSKLLEHGVDFEKVFIMGDSSGGNIAHHLAVRFGSRSPELSPIRICGYVLLAPFFGGSIRTKSEAQGPEPVLTLESLDR